MDPRGNLYVTPAFREALKTTGADNLPPEVGIVSDARLARISQKLGANSLGENELRYLADLPRKQRRLMLAELRRAGRKAK